VLLPVADTTVALANHVGPNPRLPGSVTLPPEPAPEALLSAATSALSATLKESKNLGSDSPDKFDELLASTILPLFDFRRMAQHAVAFNWRLATPEQKDALTAEFRTVVVRNYSMALAGSRDRAIEYKPLRAVPGQTEVTVKSIVKQPGGDGLSIDYDMEKTASGWKACDIRVAGISLVTNYRSAFAQAVREGGVDGLVNSLSASNRQAEPGLKARENNAEPFLLMYSVVRRFFLLGDR
jgi:phospholipid transport system substrate-binding protein